MLFREIQDDANVRHLLNQHQLLTLCDEIRSRFCTRQPGGCLDLIHAFVKAWAKVGTSNHARWTLREMTDGWEAHMDGSLIFIAYVDYTDGRVQGCFPGPSDHGMFT